MSARSRRLIPCVIVRRKPSAGRARAPAVPRHARARRTGRSVAAMISRSSAAPMPVALVVGVDDAVEEGCVGVLVRRLVELHHADDDPVDAGEPPRLGRLVGPRHIEQERLTRGLGHRHLVAPGHDQRRELGGQGQVERVDALDLALSLTHA